MAGWSLTSNAVLKRSRWSTLVPVACAVACVVAAEPAAGVSRSGALAPLPGTSACLTEPPVNRGCSLSRLGDVSDMAIAPDGRHFYVASFSTIWTFGRDRVSGALRRVRGRAGCVRQWGRPGCGRARGLGGIESIVVSPDGRHVYAAARGSRSIAAFQRHPVSGRLTQLRGRSGCVSRFPSPCSRGAARGLLQPRSLAISSDGRSVYAGSVVFSGCCGDPKGAVAVFTRNRRTGSLRQPGGALGCVAGRRDRRCTVARGLEGVGSVAVTHDGRTVYAGSTNRVLTVLTRRRGGRVAQLPGPAGCLAPRSAVQLRQRLRCGAGRHLRSADALIPSRDNRSLYAFSSDAERLLIFRRGTGGRLSQPRGARACVEWGRSPCRHARGFFEPGEPALSPDGRNLYAGTTSGWATFRRLPMGNLRQPRGRLACGLSEETIMDINEGDDEGCQHHRLPFDDLDFPPDGVASPDGRHVYFGNSYFLFSFRRL
jgi:hypothetical protein